MAHGSDGQHGGDMGAIMAIMAVVYEERERTT